MAYSPPGALASFADGQWQVMDDFAQWTQAVAGTGSTTVNSPGFVAVASGATAASSALRRTGSALGLSQGKAQDVIGWAKRIVIAFTYNQVAATDTGVSRVTLGKATGTGAGALALAGIGFQVSNLAAQGICHNGTDLATVSLSTTLTAGILYNVLIVSDNGRVEWFLNGVSKGVSAAGGPALDGTAGNSTLHVETENGADSAAMTTRVYGIRIYCEN